MKILFCIGCVIVCFVSGFAQEKSIDKSEFDRIVNNSNYPYSRWKGKSYRATVTTESRIQGPTGPDGKQFSLNPTSKMVREFGPGDTYRQLSESSFKAGEVKKSEYIRIGDFQYKRAENENWTKKPVEPAPSQADPAPAMPPGPYEIVKSEKDYKYLGTEVFRNATVRTYLASSKETSVNKANGTEYESITTTKYWIDMDGTLLRSEFRANGKGIDRSTFTGVIMDFVLDPSITITAPPVP